MIWLTLLVSLSLHGICDASRQSNRDGKMFSMFQIIRFANDACDGDGSKNGTCYSQQECESKQGTNGGSCAGGFGVCCIFDIGCGETSSENCTYVESNGVVPGACQSKICPCNNNICQLRLDFDNFVINGPVTTQASRGAFFVSNGLPVDDGPLNAATFNSQCLTDTFQVVGGGGGVMNSDVICGTNTGEHLYVEASANGCSDLVFQLGSVGYNNAPLLDRRWSIKVSQYSCDSPVLAPAGCTQYFYGSTSGTVSTFNFNNGNGHHLANQEQTICIRREKNNCRVCWYAVRAVDFKLGGAGVNGFNTGKHCCDYGGRSSLYDCIQIPGALSNAGTQMVGSNFCGRSNGLVVTNGGNGVGQPASATSNVNSQTICSRRTPFQLTFFSDHYETANSETTTRDSGAQLGYFMDALFCTN